MAKFDINVALQPSSKKFHFKDEDGIWRRIITPNTIYYLTFDNKIHKAISVDKNSESAIIESLTKLNIKYYSYKKKNIIKKKKEIIKEQRLAWKKLKKEGR